MEQETGVSENESGGERSATDAVQFWSGFPGPCFTDSCPLRNRSVAQLVEQWFPKPPVGGSSPSAPASFVPGSKFHVPSRQGPCRYLVNNLEPGTRY